ncbi:MAG: bifunctional transaldolase/phosoglucose isomerase [Candidatus Promineifilaceae bacterium]|nr:bifunctional transaldolase/phosoglucose isomerase [Candidatus Promineifilaceae bacterium]
MSKLHDLADAGQSIWLDYIRRQMLDSGELSQLREMGVRGLTSNPSIFEKAIAQSDDYDDDLRLLAAEGKSAKEIYEALAIADIQRAADEFHSLFLQTEGRDGYVSLEADPNLAYDTEATMEEVRRLFAAVDRPNVYIKVPATPEGIPAIEQLISEGININVTLLFAVGVYEQVAEAYLRGLERLAEQDGDLSKVSSVASFFVSRVDTKVDARLDEMGVEEIRGKIGIANAKMAYQRFQEIFDTERWEKLAEQGARVQRPLWGSTSTKDPAYPDTLYVDNLIGPDTVNTVPLETLEAFVDHGTVERTVDRDVGAARAHLERLEAVGVDLDDVTDELLDEGAAKFSKAFNGLMESIDDERARILGEGRTLDVALGDAEAEAAVEEALEEVEANDVLARLWEKDHTVWSEDPTEITNRLGWLDLPTTMEAAVDDLNMLTTAVRDAGYTDVLLMGMGGSSLAPELFARTFGSAPGYPTLSVLDSTDPAAVAAQRSRLDPETTLFVVSSKSGTTAETLSFFKFFYNWAVSRLGEEAAGEHFVAITDPGSQLAKTGERLNFRAVLTANPNVGGRYSALSHFGLAPASLLGIDVPELLRRAQRITGPEDAETAARLGTVLGAMARQGRDKATFLISPEIAAFADWAEQLLAESTGKEGVGILPIVGEPPADPDAYSDDRVFVYMRLADGTLFDDEAAALKDADFPVVTVHVRDRYDIGEQFLLWEIATAVAGHILGIHPFNQPNVESAKRRAKEMVAAYKEQGSLPESPPSVKAGNIAVHAAAPPASTPAAALERFLEYASSGGYVAVHAYIEPTEANDAALLQFRLYLRERSGLPVTVGYGPRFLHSTGQLHKGDGGNGLFVQITTEPLQDLPIPDEAGSRESSLTFGTLKMAQALGDAQALQDAGRRVIRLHFWGDDVPALLSDLEYE